MPKHAIALAVSTAFLCATSVLLAATPSAPHAGCELSSDLRAGDAGYFGPTWAVMPAGTAFLASRPLEGAIVLLVPEGDEYREVGLYWPTPNDPAYAYRRMTHLPSNSTLLGNDLDQTLIVLRVATEFTVKGVPTLYRPINYAGFTLSIDGCGGDDQLYGGDGPDHLYDYAGNNELRGYGGRDWLEGTGTYFAGGAGDDCITGDGVAHLSQIFGEEGDDVLANIGAAGMAQGGPGVDSCSAAGSSDCESPTPALCLGWN